MLLLAVAAASVLAGCGPRDAAFDPSQFRVAGAIAPRDVAIPSSIGAQSESYNGLYTGEPSIVSCCWLAPQATLLVRKNRPANTLVAAFWAPNIPRYKDGQSVSIAFPGSAPAGSWHIDPDERTPVLLDVPPRLRAATGLIPIQITSAIDYIPARDNKPVFSVRRFLGLEKQGPSDTRPLGVVLLYLYFDERAHRR